MASVNCLSRSFNNLETTNAIVDKNESNDELLVIAKYLKFNTDIEFHTNIVELLKLTDVYSKYKDFIYVQIGLLYKNLMKSYSLSSLRYFYKALRIKNGNYHYDTKLCLYYENCIFSLTKERAWSKINSTRNNDIKHFYNGMYKYIYNIDTFEDDIRLFLKSGIQIYQSIPLKTYTFRNELVKQTAVIPEYNLDNILVGKNKHLLIASCDTNYFNLYGKYIIESHLKYSDGVILVIDVIKNNEKTSRAIDQLIYNYNLHANVMINVKHVNVLNVKAYSSTLRFVRAHGLQDNKCLVIDIDSVILKSLKPLFLDMDEFDIGSRMLEKSYPWQTYTAGFCFFNNTKNSNKCITDVFNCLNSKMTFAEELWWIDQNVLEYGIRTNQPTLSLKNYFGIKEQYIVSPTGSAEQKMKLLTQAFTFS